MASGRFHLLPTMAWRRGVLALGVGYGQPHPAYGAHELTPDLYDILGQPASVMNRHPGRSRTRNTKESKTAPDKNKSGSISAKRGAL